MVSGTDHKARHCLRKKPSVCVCVLIVFGNQKRELKGIGVCIGKLFIFQKLVISVKMCYLIQSEFDRPLCKLMANNNRYVLSLQVSGDAVWAGR